MMKVNNISKLKNQNALKLRNFFQIMKWKEAKLKIKYILNQIIFN